MRFNEFNEAGTDKPGLYTVGDSHAAGVAAADRRWINKAKVGAKSTDPSVSSSLDDIPAGSTVIISIGHNDSTGSNRSPEEIASQVDSVVSGALQKKLKVYFLLFPTGNGPTSERNDAVRMAIYKQISPKVSTVFNLNKGALSKDGIHLNSNEYRGIGEYIIPSKAAGSTVNIKGGAGKGATVSPGDVSSYLRSKGMDDSHVLGLLANIKGESGFNAGVMGDNLSLIHI